jgi:hypothetical protein
MVAQANCQKTFCDISVDFLCYTELSIYQQLRSPMNRAYFDQTVEPPARGWEGVHAAGRRLVVLPLPLQPGFATNTFAEPLARPQS